jgi:hypothetical protein
MCRVLLFLFTFTLLTTLASSTPPPPPSPPFNASVAKTYFVDNYVRAYALRTLPNASKHSSSTTTTPTTNTSPFVGIDWNAAEEKLNQAFEMYEKAEKDGKLAKITIEGNALDAVKFAANEVWERTGGKLVQVGLETLGEAAGAGCGRYLGGTAGLALGILFPEIEVPIVIGGVFVGSKFGQVLGLFAGKVAAKIANEWLEDEIIDPQVESLLLTALNTTMLEDSRSPDSTCDSNMCKSNGVYQKSCKCESCGRGEYQDETGASSCKTCPQGWFPCERYTQGGFCYAMVTHCNGCRKY